MRGCEVISLEHLLIRNGMISIVSNAYFGGFGWSDLSDIITFTIDKMICCKYCCTVLLFVAADIYLYVTVYVCVRVCVSSLCGRIVIIIASVKIGRIVFVGFELRSFAPWCRTVSYHLITIYFNNVYLNKRLKLQLSHRYCLCANQWSI